ncbi:MAG: ATP-binding cassette domain-containing protein [Candidimonas sp.]
MSEPILTVRGVSKDFVTRRSLFGAARDVVHAVRDVSLTAQAGTTVAVVGESGSGKSTLGRCITALDTVTSGTIRLAGHDVAKLSGPSLMAFRRTVQTIFQDPYSSLNPRRRVGDAVMDGMTIHGLYTKAERHERMISLLERVGLSADHARRYPHQFSGGQRQRISIARALAVTPSFIVADEAVSALDVSIKAQVLDLMRDIQAEHGLTYLFISHDLGVVRHFADRVLIMSGGRLIEEGPTDQIFGHPREAYTQRLIEAVPRPDPSRRRFRARAGA